jgi:hypothetical protein
MRSRMQRLVISLTINYSKPQMMVSSNDSNREFLSRPTSDDSLDSRACVIGYASFANF